MVHMPSYNILVVNKKNWIMKNIITKLILLFVTILVSVRVSADGFSVDGIYYEVVSLSELTCEVVSGNEKYTGDIVIPETVTYEGRTFTVISIGRSAFFLLSKSYKC